MSDLVLDQRVEPDPSRPGSTTGSVFVFSGQGNQWPGMGADLIDAGSAGAQCLAECDEVVRDLAGWSILDRLTTGEADALTDPALLQPTLVALQLALAAELRSAGYLPAVCCGHSLGEIAAATVAGAITPAEALRLAELRGRLMRTATGTGLTALLDVGDDLARSVIARHGGEAEIAAWNAPRATVIAGTDRTVRAVVDALTAEQVFARVL